jgi:hypothetical protein
MIYDEALREAERRWGEKGYVRDQATEFNRFRVGLQDGGVFWVKGVGRTWEEAFEAADRRREADCLSLNPFTLALNRLEHLHRLVQDG